MAVSVLARIEATFNVALGLRVFFDSPRIKDIAEAVDLKTLKEKSDAFIVNENNYQFFIPFHCFQVKKINRSLF